MDDRIHLTVVIPHYGDAVPTEALVASLVPQLMGVRGEIVVVDDCSPDPLGEMENTQVVRRATNGGFAAAVNTGVAVARGEWVAILNSDLSVGPDFLATYLDAAEPFMPAVVAPRVVQEGHIGASTFRFPSARTVLAQRTNVVGHRRQRRWISDLIGEDKPVSAESVHRPDWVSGAAMLMPAAQLRAVGGFDENFHMYLEEVDLQRRLRDLGVPAVYVGSVVVCHVGFGSSESAFREQWQIDSWVTYADKWGWRRRLWVALVGSSAVNLVVDSMRVALGRKAEPVAAWKRQNALRKSAWRVSRERRPS